jgi:hypothetical protein
MADDLDQGAPSDRRYFRRRSAAVRRADHATAAADRALRTVTDERDLLAAQLGAVVDVLDGSHADAGERGACTACLAIDVIDPDLLAAARQDVSAGQSTQDGGAS